MAQIESNTTPTSSSSILQRSIRFRREIGLLPAISFAFVAISLSLGGIFPYAVFAGLFPGVNILQIILVATGVSLVFGTIYSAIGGLVPHDGSDYVLTSRVFGGAVGFATSFAMVILLALSAGAVISMLPKLILPGLLLEYGMVGGSTVGNLGTSISQNSTSVIIATVLVLLAFAGAIIPRKYIRWMLGIGAGLTILAWGWMILTLYGKTGSQFPLAWDAVMGLEHFVTQIQSAQAAGLPLYKDPLLGILAGGALSLWLFFGSFSLVNASGEMKKPGRDLPISHLVSVLVAGGLMVGVTLLLRRLNLPEWYSAESYLFLKGVDTQTMPWVFFYAAIFQQSPAFLLLMILSWVFGFVNLLQTIFYYASRILWAWGKDRVVPEAMSFVHAHWRSPLVATLIFAIVVQVGVMIAIQIPRLFLSRAYIAPLMVLLIVPLAAVVVAGFTKPNWFASASGIAHWRIGRFPLLSLFAFIGIVYLVASLVIMANGRLGIFLFTGGDAALIIVLLLAGLAWFAGRRSWLQRSQINLKDTFKELPEE
jgi:APA family basic amino acid/polyamine antiporter